MTLSQPGWEGGRRAGCVGGCLLLLLHTLLHAQRSAIQAGQACLVGRLGVTPSLGMHPQPLCVRQLRAGRASGLGRGMVVGRPWRADE